MSMPLSQQHHPAPVPPDTIASMRPDLALHTSDDPRRGEVEAFIRAVYSRRYGADIQHFAPVLVSLQDQGEIVAAAGYRCAADGPLFLERYLPQPVDSLLAVSDAAVPPRRSVVEVGNLAADRAGEGRRLIALLGGHLAAEGFEWVVGTITVELRQLFIRLGVTPLALGTADATALGDDAARWGSYYQHNPVVLAGNLGQALRRMAQRQLAQRSQAAQRGVAR